MISRVLLLGGVIFFVFMLVISIFGGSFYSVDQGERAVITRWGEIVSVEGPGFHSKTPFIEDANIFEMRQLSTELKDVRSYSKDQQTAVLTLVVLWHAVEGREKEIYTRYGGLRGLESRELLAKLPSSAKVVFGSFDAKTSIENRANLIQKIQAELVTDIGKDPPLVVDSVQLANIDFSDAYEHAIEARMQAEVDSRRAEQTAIKTVTEAKADAESNLARRKAEAEGNFAIADAQARGINALAEAEANRLRQRGEALRNNPNLIELTTAEKWDGKLPVTMIPGGALPFVSLGGESVR